MDFSTQRKIQIYSIKAAQSLLIVIASSALWHTALTRQDLIAWMAGGLLVCCTGGFVYLGNRFGSLSKADRWLYAWALTCALLGAATTIGSAIAIAR